MLPNLTLDRESHQMHHYPKVDYSSRELQMKRDDDYRLDRKGDRGIQILVGGASVESTSSMDFRHRLPLLRQQNHQEHQC